MRLVDIPPECDAYVSYKNRAKPRTPICRFSPLSAVNSMAFPRDRQFWCAISVHPWTTGMISARCTMLLSLMGLQRTEANATRVTAAGTAAGDNHPGGQRSFLKATHGRSNTQTAGACLQGIWPDRIPIGSGWTVTSSTEKRKRPYLSIRPLSFAMLLRRRVLTDFARDTATS